MSSSYIALLLRQQNTPRDLKDFSPVIVETTFLLSRFVLNIEKIHLRSNWLFIYTSVRAMMQKRAIVCRSFSCLPGVFRHSIFELLQFAEGMSYKASEVLLLYAIISAEMDSFRFIVTSRSAATTIGHANFHCTGLITTCCWERFKERVPRCLSNVCLRCGSRPLYQAGSGRHNNYRQKMVYVSMKLMRTNWSSAKQSSLSLKLQAWCGYCRLQCSVWLEIGRIGRRCVQILESTTIWFTQTIMAYSCKMYVSLV